MLFAERCMFGQNRHLLTFSQKRVCEDARFIWFSVLLVVAALIRLVSTVLLFDTDTEKSFCKEYSLNHSLQTKNHSNKDDLVDGIIKQVTSIMLFFLCRI